MTGALHALKAEAIERNSARIGLLELAKSEARKIGIAEFARRLQVDVSNLQKAVKTKFPVWAQ
jgi:hypothetical protein